MLIRNNVQTCLREELLKIQSANKTIRFGGPSRYLLIFLCFSLPWLTFGSDFMPVWKGSTNLKQNVFVHMSYTFQNSDIWNRFHCYIFTEISAGPSASIFQVHTSNRDPKFWTSKVLPNVCKYLPFDMASHFRRNKLPSEPSDTL